jgi:hypothetical protein
MLQLLVRNISLFLPLLSFLLRLVLFFWRGAIKYEYWLDTPFPEQGPHLIYARQETPVSEEPVHVDTGVYRHLLATQISECNFLYMTPSMIS